MATSVFGALRVPDVVYRYYERRLARSLTKAQLPGHIGVVLDGNRRWAKQTGASTAYGHQVGAEKIHEFLHWVAEFNIPVVTLYMLSTQNLNRDKTELEPLIKIIAQTLRQLGSGLKDGTQLKVHPVGDQRVLPQSLVDLLNETAETTRYNTGLHVNVAIGYGGREEIVDAAKSFLTDTSELGYTLDQAIETLDVDAISARLYTRGQPDPDLVIRTSGEQRLSGFLMWQSAYSEFYFCEALWPAFRRVDFIRALRDYATRNRRYGS
ncbi:isoprenyl transferase [Yaniella halotolerans]|uniref:isoprenyl transferase n=1 Tax=Yaniella halotolerans TaxID=225453 RepID=UPI0003B41058